MKRERVQSQRREQLALSGGAARLLRLACALALPLGVGLLCQLALASSASALASRGHVFETSFEGEGEHVFAKPAGIALNEASGEVYVADPAQNRVERFKPNGHGGYEFAAELKVLLPGAIAVDNAAGSPSKGDLYVAGTEEKEEEASERDFIYKFGPANEKIYKKNIFKGKEAGEPIEAEPEDISGLAVDASGKVFVYWEEEGNISALTADEKSALIPSLTKERILDEHPLLEQPCEAREGFALGPEDQSFYLAHEREVDENCFEEESRPRIVSKLSAAGEALTRSIVNQNTTGVATDAEGNVYADNVTSVGEFSASGSPGQRFGEGQLSSGAAIAADSRTGQVFVAQEGKITIFKGEEAGSPPSVDSVSAQNLSPTSERLNAEIDPHGAATHYFFQYGSADCQSDPSACTDVPAEPGAELGAVFGDRSVSVEVAGLAPNTLYHYRVLAKNAHGEVESAQSAETFFTTLPSAAQTLADHRSWELVSPPNKHGAAIEAISREGAPIQAAQDGEAISWAATAPVTEEAQGDRRPEPVQVLSHRSEEGWASQDIATPHNKGEGFNPGEQTAYRVFSPDLALAIIQPQFPSLTVEGPQLSPLTREKDIYLTVPGSGRYQPLVTEAQDTAKIPYGHKLEFYGGSPDLKHDVFGSEVALLSGQSGERGLYEWQPPAGQEGGEAEGQLRLISTLPGSATLASEPALGAMGLNTRGAVSSDGSKVFWTEAEFEGPLYMSKTQTGETIQIDAAQGPGTSEPTAEEREEELAAVHFQAATPSGSRVFFTDAWPLTSDSGLEPREEEEFGEALGRPFDLYEYNTETGKLSDLSPDHNAGEQAEVLGTIPGVSQDGSYVYFVANGVLAPGAQHGNCPRNQSKLPHPQAQCNLYVSEPDPQSPGQRQTRLIARVSAEDGGDWASRLSAGEQEQVLGDLTSEISPNGRYLSFMSSQELTGYDNEDQSPAAKGAHDQEAYLYDAESASLTCVSCNPEGRRPHGVFDTEESGEGLGLLVDRPQTWNGEWLAGSIPGWTFVGLTEANYQSRYLSNEGRMFFNAADALTGEQRMRPEQVEGQEAQVGVENVYEYEPQNVGSCANEGGCVALVSSDTSQHESAFLDASEGGDGAFFMTAAPLLAEDTDSAYDVYDANVCGTADSRPCLPERQPAREPCTGEGCREAPASQLSFPGPTTQTSSGPGNAVPPPSTKVSKPSAPKPLTRAQKLARALKACRKLKRKKSRQACERKARKTFGPKHKAKRAKRGARGGKSSKGSTRRHGR